QGSTAVPACRLPSTIRAMVQESLVGGLVCPSCGAADAPPRKNCNSCWVRLVPAEAAAPRRLQARARRWNGRRWLLVTAVVLVALWVSGQVWGLLWPELRPV